MPPTMSNTSAGDNRASLAERMAWSTTPKTKSKPTSMRKGTRRPSLCASVSLAFKVSLAAPPAEGNAPLAISAPQLGSRQLADECRAADRDRTNWVGNNDLVPAKKLLDRRQQLRGQHGSQFIKTVEVGIKRAPAEPGLPDHVLGGDRGDGAPREKCARRLNNASSTFGAALPADFCPPYEIDLDHRRWPSFLYRKVVLTF